VGLDFFSINEFYLKRYQECATSEQMVAAQEQVRAE
jgi:ribosome biogenesis protein Tsr3